MPFQLGNVFGSKTKRQPEMSHASLAATPQDAQAALERATQAYQGKVDELMAARSRVAELNRLIGTKLADNDNADSDTAHRQSMLAHIQQLESAIAVLKQRKDEAQAAVQRADQAKAIEDEVAALEKNKNVALRIDAAFEALRQLAEEHAATWEAVRQVGGNQYYASSQTDAKLQFQLFMNLSGHAFTGVGHAPGPFMKFRQYSGCAPDPDTARTRKRT